MPCTYASDSDEPLGIVTISAPESLCTYRLPRLLQVFRERFPQVQVIFRPSRVASATDDPILLAGLPEDIETLRHRSPDVAADWRLALRDVLRMAFQSGYRISGLDDGGHYVLQRAGG